MKYKNLLTRTFLFAFLGLLSAVILLPFGWMLSCSIKPAGEILVYPPRWIPDNPTLSNYLQVFQDVPFVRFILNSSFVASVVVASVLFTSSLGGYAFAKHQFKGRDTVFLMVLATMMIPLPTLLIPLYLMVDKLGWVDTYWALIVPFLSNAYAIYFMRQFIRTIPSDLIDAAKIDGCSELRIYWTVILPLSKSALATLGLLTFLWNWDFFIWPVVVINTAEMRTVPLGLALFTSAFGNSWHLIMAGTVIATMPVFAIFLLAQRYLVQGIALTGLKGG